MKYQYIIAAAANNDYDAIVELLELYNNSSLGTVVSTITTDYNGPTLRIPYNINNIPTYVMTLKDDGGLVKMYAMVAINDYTIVGVGNSMREALTSYKSVYNSAGNKINPSSSDAKKRLKTLITRIQSDVKNGNSFYYFTVKDYPNIFVGSSQVSSELPVSVVGDSIEISFDIDEEKVIDVTQFNNKNLK